jgi:hypothetical protein
LVVSCYEGVQRVGPLPPTVHSWYTVLKDGTDFHPDLPQMVASDALTWGYGGSGPLALAFALLTDEFGEPIAWLYCRVFCDTVVAAHGRRGRHRARAGAPDVDADEPGPARNVRRSAAHKGLQPVRHPNARLHDLWRERGAVDRVEHVADERP